LELQGIKLIGLNSETAMKAALTLAVLAAAFLIRWLVLALVRSGSRSKNTHRIAFWVRQGFSLTLAALILIALISIWFDNAARLTTVAGFAAAGLAVAAQRVVTAFAGYLIIMRGNSFTVGDRIKMGGVHGDVIDLGFLQTRILEMGQPPPVNEQEDPGMWVQARQYTGRVVIVTNDKIFEEPIYNFSRELPYVWEEMRVGIPFDSDHARAEQIFIDAANDQTREYWEQSAPARRAFEERYRVKLDRHEPKCYMRLKDNALELVIRFLIPDRGVGRGVKDAITRRLVAEFGAAGIEFSSPTLEIVKTPPLRIEGTAGKVT
jgi:small-conductance mechanosensitive channel